MTTSSASEQSTLESIAGSVLAGKADAETDIPPGSKGQPGVVEWIKKALAENLDANLILTRGLQAGMQEVGRRFGAAEIFVPEVLIAARAMQAGIAVLKPALAAKKYPERGVFVIGTVRGDLHDIGKNLVAIILGCAGWRIEDLGVDCAPERFAQAVADHPGCGVGLSALLTTTMLSMRDSVNAIRERSADTVILVGGAPVTADFAREIGAGGYAADPAAAANLLDKLLPSQG